MSRAKDIYFETRKRHDQLFNTYVMRPVAALLVAALSRTSVTPNQVTLASITFFVIGAGLMVALGGIRGGLIAVAVMELSYLLDCADGMLARHKKIASKAGHLFDFFTDELKAVMLAAVVGVRLWRFGGRGYDVTAWPPHDARFLLATIAVVGAVSSAISLTNFVRRPEISGKETPVEAHYEAAGEAASAGGARWLVSQAMTFLRFLNHYPSHIWIFVAVGRLDAFFWMYGAINLLYLARGWLGLFLRFGRRGS